MAYTKSRLERHASRMVHHGPGGENLQLRRLLHRLAGYPRSRRQKSKSPRYHRHPEEQVIYLLEGEFDVLLPEGPVRLVAGDVLAIPGNVIHGARRENDGGLLMLNIFTPRRPDDFTHKNLKMYDTLAEVP